VSGRQEAPEHITLAPDDYFRVIEERRRAAEGVLWQLPSISLAAQAFLLSAGLRTDVTPSSQIVVGSLGIAVVLGTGLIILYQTVRATTFVSWLSQTVCQPLGPDKLEAELKVNSRKISVECAYKAFCVACGGSLLAFLVADGYVLGQGVGWW
jgi:hypothetical protein